MSKTGRTYGDKPSRPIYVWNGILEPKHRERIGPAIWLFLYFIDRTTKERPNKQNPDEIQGWVYGKMPLTLRRMASETGLPERTISAHLLRLECHDYIRTVRAPHGLIILVQKSYKWKGEKEKGRTCHAQVTRKRSAENGESRYAENGESPAKTCVSPAENGECGKDKAVDLSVDKEIRGESTAHSASFSPLSELKPENQSQPQEISNPLPIEETQSPRPYTDAVLREGLRSLGKVPGPQRKPFTEAELREQQRWLRERYPEQFANAGKVATA
jgi:hypothetical protein